MRMMLSSTGLPAPIIDHRNGHWSLRRQQVSRGSKDPTKKLLAGGLPHLEAIPVLEVK
jgi:hypothetical protein